MYNIIPLLLILISLSVIIAIVVSKFTVLANLDLANIPAEKEARFKERIIGNRLKRNIIKWLAKFSRLLMPIARGVGSYFKFNLHKLYQLKNNYLSKDLSQGAGDEQQIDQLFALAEEFKKRGDLAEAENKYIKIIALDSKNLKAFKGLGLVYFEKKQYEEAKQTFKHVLKLKEDDQDIYENLARIAQERGNLDEARDEYLKSINVNKQNAQTYYNLACVYQAMGKWPEAIINLKKALKIEPANPKYLDTMLEISIIIKDKAQAMDAYRKLFKANPDNNKIAEFKKRIDEI